MSKNNNLEGAIVPTLKQHGYVLTERNVGHNPIKSTNPVKMVFEHNDEQGAIHITQEEGLQATYRITGIGNYEKAAEAVEKTIKTHFNGGATI